MWKEKARPKDSCHRRRKWLIKCFFQLLELVNCWVLLSSGTLLAAVSLSGSGPHTCHVRTCLQPASIHRLKMKSTYNYYLEDFYRFYRKYDWGTVRTCFIIPDSGLRSHRSCRFLLSSSGYSFAYFCQVHSTLNTRALKGHTSSLTVGSWRHFFP